MWKISCRLFCGMKEGCGRIMRKLLLLLFFYYFINSYCNICLLLYFWINLLQSVFRIYPNPWTCHAQSLVLMHSETRISLIACRHSQRRRWRIVVPHLQLLLMLQLTTMTLPAMIRTEKPISHITVPKYVLQLTYAGTEESYATPASYAAVNNDFRRWLGPRSIIHITVPIQLC